MVKPNCFPWRGLTRTRRNFTCDIRNCLCDLSGTAERPAARLFFELALLGRIRRAFEVDAISVGIVERHHPEAVADKGPSAGFDSARLELAIKRQGVLAKKADRHSG